MDFVVLGQICRWVVPIVTPLHKRVSVARIKTIIASRRVGESESVAQLVSQPTDPPKGATRGRSTLHMARVYEPF